MMNEASDMPETDVPETDVPETAQKSNETEFERQADAAQVGIVREFWDFLKYNKKWWLTPIIVSLLLLGVLVLLSSTAAAPFIYTLF